MKFRWKNIWKETKRHFLSDASFALSTYEAPPSYQSNLDSLNAQILKAVEESDKRTIFILAPRGAGKTTHLQSFIKANPHFKYRYKSFIRIDSFDFAFMHLTEKPLRFFFLSLGMIISYYLFPLLPSAAVSPLIVLFALSIMKTFGHSFYILHEIVDNLFNWKSKIVIIEDLEESLIDENKKWEFLANLWQNNRTYIVTLGYASQNPKRRLEFIENAVKLGGHIIQVLPDEKANFELMKRLDPNFPFLLLKGNINHGWLSLFTFREMNMLYEQVYLQMEGEEDISTEKKQFATIELALSLLLAKIGFHNQEFMFNKTKKQLQKPLIEKMNSTQIHYIDSFCKSVLPELGIEVTQLVKEIKDIKEESPKSLKQIVTKFLTEKVFEKIINSAERVLPQAQSTVYIHVGSLPREGSRSLAWRCDPLTKYVVEGHQVFRVSQTAENKYCVLTKHLFQIKNLNNYISEGLRTKLGPIQYNCP